MTTGLQEPTVTREARINPHGIGSVSYPVATDPTHEKAWHAVENQVEDFATVRDPESGTILFRAWRVSSTSWAWQTSVMPAPAFMPYAP